MTTTATPIDRAAIGHAHDRNRDHVRLTPILSASGADLGLALFLLTLELEPTAAGERVGVVVCGGNTTAVESRDLLSFVALSSASATPRDGRSALTCQGVSSRWSSASECWRFDMIGGSPGAGREVHGR
jgi:hypothetical protein